jgi:hypothetical protein
MENSSACPSVLICSSVLSEDTEHSDVSIGFATLLSVWAGGGEASDDLKILSR